MTYINEWGDEGSYSDVYDATLDRMTQDDLIYELSYCMSAEHLLRWIMNNANVYEVFWNEHNDVISTVEDCWVTRHMDEEDDE